VAWGAVKRLYEEMPDGQWVAAHPTVTARGWLRRRLPSEERRELGVHRRYRTVRRPVSVDASDAPAAGSGRFLELLSRLLGRHGRRIRELFFGVLAPFCLFAILAREVAHPQPLPWDAAVLTWLHGHSSPLADRVMLGASRVGTWYGVVPCSILLAMWLLTRREVARFSFFSLSMLGPWLLSDATKRLFGRERPVLWPSPAPETSFSFPSGHAMGSMALAVAVAVLAWRTRYRWVAVLGGAAFTAVVSGSRLYLGVHYPTDVLGAWLASLAWVLGLRHILLSRVRR